MTIKVLTCTDETLVLDLLGQVPMIHEGDEIAIPGECFNDISLRCRVGLALENESLRNGDLYKEIHAVLGDPMLSELPTLMWAVTKL